MILNGDEADPGRLNLTGDGAGRFVLQGRTEINGDVREDQTVTVQTFEGQGLEDTRATSIQNDLTNDGTVILDCTTGTAEPCNGGLSTLNVVLGTFTNDGTLSTGAPGGNGRIFSHVVSAGTVTLNDDLGLFSFSPWEQTGGTTPSPTACCSTSRRTPTSSPGARWRARARSTAA